MRTIIREQLKNCVYYQTLLKLSMILAVSVVYLIYAIYLSPPYLLEKR